MRAVAFRRVGAPPTVGAWLRRLARVVLWLTVLILLLRGLSATFAASPSTGRAAPHRAAAWPDARVGAFAAEFAAAWLAVNPDAIAYRDRVAAFADDGALEALPVAAPKAARVTVGSVVVAGMERVSQSSARVTVAAVTSTGRVWLTARVDRDGAGRLVVVGAPALVAAPARGTVESRDPEPLPAALDDARDLAARYVTAYVTGHPESLAYLVPAGSPTPPALAAGFALDGDPEVTVAGDPAPRGLTVVVRVAVTDRARARWGLTYRLALLRTDRWYVLKIDGGS
jgi:hypothetical protein